jgi:hypothetical protein
MMKTAFHSPIILRAACIAAMIVFLARAWILWAESGLFYSPGLDYAIYGASAEVVTESGWPSLYDKEAHTRAFAGWLSGGLDRSDLSTFVAWPYPAPFLLPFFATNFLGHLGGFVAWTLLNILLYAAIVRGLAGPGRNDPLTSLAPFAFLPFLFNLYIGQLVIMMSFGLYRSLRAFEEGREWAAGCWLGLLLVKPQFGLILAPVLLVKRRWSALAGLSSVAAGLAASTFALVGAGGMRDYREMARFFSGFRRVPRIVYPWDMINFRGLLVQALPDSWSEDQATRAVFALSALLTLTLIAVWRGPWQPRSERFARQMLGTMIVAVFTSFHSHIHAATLLVVPLLAALRGRPDADLLRNLSVLLMLVPTFSVSINGNLVLGAWLLMIVMAGIYWSVIAEPKDRDSSAAIGEARVGTMPLGGLTR